MGVRPIGGHERGAAKLFENSAELFKAPFRPPGLRRSAAKPAHAGVIDLDRFDAITWRDIESQATAIRASVIAIAKRLTLTSVANPGKG